MSDSDPEQPSTDSAPPPEPGRAKSPEPVYEARPEPSARFVSIRAAVVGAVLMWVILVGAWALNRGFDVWTAAQRERAASDARLRLASVEELSGVFNAVNTALEPAVVKIDVTRPASSAPDDPRRPPGGRDGNSGSGVIVQVDGDARRNVGYVVTNHHVVNGATRISVMLSDGRRVDARTLGTDPPTDLAVLQIDAPGLVSAEWGDSDTLRKGDWVLAFGSPFGFVGSMTAGVVSALNRTQTDGVISPGEDAYQAFIQTDAAINPGNSGGPLVSVAGQVIGINSAIFTRTGDFSGIGFAIPSNQARRVFEDIRDKGQVERGWLGVNVATVADMPEIARRLGFPEGESGVLVEQVWQGTPAAEAGLRRLDIVRLINGEPLNDYNGLRNRAAFARPGDRLTLTVWRGGEERDIEVTVGPMPQGRIDLSNLVPQLDTTSYGLKLANPPEGTPSGPAGSAVVESVEPQSIAAGSGLRVGDRVIAVNGRPIANADDARQAIAFGNADLGVELHVITDGRVLTVVLRR